MARRLHSDDVEIEQQDDLIDGQERKPEIVQGEPVRAAAKDQQLLADLAMAEEPVEIIIQPRQEKNAAMVIYCAVNGVGAKMLVNGHWMPTTGYLPVNQPITIQRKALEVLARAKVTKIETWHDDATVERPRNGERRFTTGVHNFTVLRDDNPRGREWLTELLRRNF